MWAYPGFRVCRVSGEDDGLYRPAFWDRDGNLIRMESFVDFGDSHAGIYPVGPYRRDHRGISLDILHLLESDEFLLPDFDK